MFKDCYYPSDTSEAYLASIGVCPKLPVAPDVWPVIDNHHLFAHAIFDRNGTNQPLKFSLGLSVK